MKFLARAHRDPLERRPPVEMTPTVTPSVDIYESEQEVYLIADLPGVSKSEVRVEVEKGRLCLAATRAGAGGRPIEYRRDIRMPENIEAEKVSAQMLDGVLRVHLPRSSQRKGRQITIRPS
ncbi:MAG: Hsp20 family protein [Deltaproteobacteria bacterium]|nr:Hsp20 family protein [Deltaproteobacteria bacterium]